MRKNVLIYGFGWTGKAALELCEDMGFECKIIDDSGEIENEYFMTYESLQEELQDNPKRFDAYLVAVSGKLEISEAIKNKLLSIKDVRGGGQLLIKG